MNPRNVYTYLQPTMHIPQVDMAGCDIVMWEEDGEIYWLETDTGKVYRVLVSSLADVILSFPPKLALCILMENGKLGRVTNTPLQ